MSSARNPLPPPDISDTDPTKAKMAQRFSLGGNPLAGATNPLAAAAPAPAERALAMVPKPSKGTRPDPEGMKRASYYVAKEAAEALDEAADWIQQQIPGLPRHAALTALFATMDPSKAVESVAQARADQLRNQLAALNITDS
ncbi:MAG: hypothetical protein AUG49_25270 [Catenulispora sp. 13_1_20CM_3_70_7]|nr:MAG: hypothetical protein AUG49_25270 [Catenulispora sp. 13_1_20CM_3_70_7]